MQPYQAGKKLQRRGTSCSTRSAWATVAARFPPTVRRRAARVAIARALIVDPPLLLAVSRPNLDSATGETIVDLLLELHARIGATLLVATHDPAVDARCDVPPGDS